MAKKKESRIDISTIVLLIDALLRGSEVSIQYNTDPLTRDKLIQFVEITKRGKMLRAVTMATVQGRDADALSRARLHLSQAKSILDTAKRAKEGGTLEDMKRRIAAPAREEENKTFDT